MRALALVVALVLSVTAARADEGSVVVITIPAKKHCRAVRAVATGYHAAVFTVKHPIKTVYKVGEWNDRTHFGSAVGLAGNVGMAIVGVRGLKF